MNSKFKKAAAIRVGLIISLALGLSSQMSFAGDPLDSSSCKEAAKELALAAAKKRWDTSKIKYVDGSVAYVYGRGKSKISFYKLGLQECDDVGCSDVSFEIAMDGIAPDCKINKVLFLERTQ